MTATGQADDGRDETPAERLDRNWNDLLQELRVLQTGVQLLAGFLLTLPFQSTFRSLQQGDKIVYLGTIGSAFAAVSFLVAPVSLHRVLFRLHLRRRMVLTGHYLAMTGSVFLALTIVGSVLLTFTIVVGRTAAIVFAALTALLLSTLWAIIPTLMRSDHPPGEDVIGGAR